MGSSVQGLCPVANWERRLKEQVVNHVSVRMMRSAWPFWGEV
jgi:hypothetical protein